MPEPDPPTILPVSRRPRPPDHLAPASRALWRSIVRDNVLAPYHVSVLGLACVALDRAEAARLDIEANGALIEGRYGPRPNPSIANERDSAIRAARMLRELGLDLGDDRLPTPWRPA